MDQPQQPEYLRRRLVRGTQRRVWVEDDTVVKEFEQITWPGDIRRPWRREHRALAKLQAEGVKAPLSYGYKSTAKGIIQLRRQHVAGDILSSFDGDTIKSVAEYLGKIQSANVVSCDPSADNFLIDQQGDLMCIDYGRARVFSLKGPYFYWYVGKELHRVNYILHHTKPELWHPFIDSYKAASNYPSRGWAIVNISLRVCLNRKGIKSAYRLP